MLEKNTMRRVGGGDDADDRNSGVSAHRGRHTTMTTIPHLVYRKSKEKVVNGVNEW